MGNTYYPYTCDGSYSWEISWYITDSYGSTVASGSGIDCYGDDCSTDCSTSSFCTWSAPDPTAIPTSTPYPTISPLPSGVPTPSPTTAAPTLAPSWSGRPNFCTFETGTCTFSSPGEYKWEWGSGSATEDYDYYYGSGPTEGHDGGYYVYVDSSWPNYPDKGPFNLQSDVTSIRSVTFWYNMYGEDMGTLTFDTSSNDGGSWSTRWSLSGDQGESWEEATVNVPRATTTIRFAGTTGRLLPPL